MSIIYVVVGKS